jgi:hypothetical protein
MPHIVRAAVQTVTTCQSVFADRRWNCTSIETAPSFTPDITTGNQRMRGALPPDVVQFLYRVYRLCNRRRWLSSGILCRVVWYILTDVSEVLTASIIRTKREGWHKYIDTTSNCDLCNSHGVSS